MTQPECYGRMFPDLLNLVFNHPNRGKVATIDIEAQGIGVQRKQMTIDRSQWATCVECHEFEHCYKLSLAEAVLQHALLGIV